MAATATAKNWFDVDKEGLAAILQRRGVEFALFELVSNALDTKARSITVTVLPVKGRALANVSVVDDDPDGFKDLTHAFTLFAPSEKKSKVDKRGRFNLGEKLVLAICDEAAISSTTGTVLFTRGGRVNQPSKKRAAGSGFAGVLRMTHEEAAMSVKALRTLLVPVGVNLTINGERVMPREPVAVFSTTLATEIADADGNLKRSRAITTVKVYEPREGETPSLYELGIPVVETNDRFHIDVAQKVPLNMDRDNVPPAFLRELRAHVLNAVHSRLEADEAAAPWVREAASSPECSDAAIKTVLDHRYGEKRVGADPSDREAECKAKANGYAVVHGGSLTAGEWANAKRAGVIQPAGEVMPTPKPFHPGGKPLKLLHPDDMTTALRALWAYAADVGRRLLGRGVLVRLVDDPGWGFAGTFARESNELNLNVGSIGHDCFNKGPTAEINQLLIHEFAHSQGHHLEASYAEACAEFGAKLVEIALAEPQFFKRGA